MAEDDPTKQQEELIQVAAVALAWWEQLERESTGDNKVVADVVQVDRTTE